MRAYRQLSLAITLDDQATFDNFYAPRGTPQHLATLVLQDDQQQYTLLVGNSGTGLSHLLQAACQSVALGQHQNALYLPLGELQEYPPEQVLEDLESAAVIGLDDFHLVADKPHWQIPLFNLFNRCRDAGSRLMVASHVVPDDMGVTLADLSSRLKSGVTMQIAEYKDQDQRRLLQYRANRRGMYLADEVAVFLLNRLPRDSHALMQALEKLDNASLQEQRRLTTPFVKTTLRL